MNKPTPSSLLRRRIAVWGAAAVATFAVLATLGWFYLWPALEVDAAEEALRRHDPLAARDHLDRYLRRWPEDGRALFLAAQAARRCRAYADAERFLTLAERKAGATEATRLEWALLGAQQGDFLGREGQLQGETVRKSPEAAAILEALAVGYDASYRWMDCTTALERLLQHDADHVAGLILRGNLADRLRQPGAAEKDLRRAVSLAPDNAATHTALADYYQRHGFTREAVRHYELVLKLRPGHPAARLGLARAYIDAADPAAERTLDELLAAQPDHVEALVERGRLELRRKQPASAEPFLQRAIARAPWHREAHRLLLAALKDLGRTADVAACETRIAALTAEDGVAGRLKLKARDNPADTEVRWELWQWSLRNGEEAEGVVWLFEILRSDPRHAQAHAALAEYFERVGQPRRAALHREPPPNRE